jgi:hypothetical protein
MKKWSGIVLAVSLFGLVCETTFAATPACLVKLAWQSSADRSVTGYALYYGATGGPFTNRLDVGMATTAVISNLTASATYSFCVVAYDGNYGESDPSNILHYTAQAVSSLNLSRTQGSGMSVSFNVAPGAACHVEYTDTLSPPNWQMLNTAMGDSNGVVTVVDTVAAPGGSRFYRAVVP